MRLSSVLEQRELPGHAGAGLLVQPNGLAVLDGLGLGGRLRRAGKPVRETLILSSNGRSLSSLKTPDFGDGLDHVLAVGRAELHHMLLESVEAEPAVSIRFGTKVLAAGSAGTVALAGDGSAALSGVLVVAADGVNSAVRDSGRFGTVRTSGPRFIRTLVPTAALAAVLPGEQGLPGEYWTQFGLFGGAPIDAHRTYVYCSATDHGVAAALRQGDLAALRRLWAGQLPIAGRALEAVNSIEDLIVSDADRVDNRRWAEGRIVLLGDAAHAMSPALGQGANSALVDAAVLADELCRSEDVPTALRCYTARRRSAVKRVQDRADVLTRLSHLRPSALHKGRDLLLSTLNRLPGNGERMVRSAQQEDPARIRALVSGLGRPQPGP